MVEFPRDAHFLCRKCKGRFLISEEQFDSAKKARDVICPGCGAETRASRAKIEKFFRFYPRFVAAIDQLAESGFPLTGYGIDKHDMAPYYRILSLTFRCGECGKEHRVPMREARELIKAPKLFFCRHCRHHQTPASLVKEFFVAAINLDEAAVHFGALQRNMFSPYGFETQWVDL